MIEVVILAAGKGTRMRSKLPKVLQALAGRPLVAHVIDAARALNAEAIHLVVGHGAEQVRECLGNSVRYVEQREQLGTGHAVQQALPALSEQADILILYGDVPLISAATLSRLLAHSQENTMALLTVKLKDPSGYGRIVRDQNRKVQAIVEQKDASAEQLKIQEVNTGVMALRAKHLRSWLPRLQNNNAQGEYYLTDLIEMAVASGVEVQTCEAASEHEVLGVNTRRQQAELERLYQQELAGKLLDAGLSLRDPARFDCRGRLQHGEDCVIDVNCVLEGEIVLGNNVTIGQNCYLKDVNIGDNTEILANSVLESSNIGANCHIGPFARLRPGTQLAQGAKVGNFVEIKNAVIGEHSKVNHLSYVGDAELGKDVNIGAGTITCNYDGANKHRTVIEDGVFVGSNTALVAPLTLEEGSTIGAGSTITAGAQKGQLVVARAKQRTIEGWERPSKKK